MTDPAAATCRAPGPPRTLLLIDDSRMIRQIIIKTLRGKALFDTYLEAVDGVAGLEVATSRDVDVILCDLDMPNLDGFGFLEQFRAHPRGRTIPVLMLSGSEQSAKKIEGLDRGADDYIVKPCDPVELCTRVRSYLRLKLLQDELESKNQELDRKNRQLAQMAITAPLG